MNALVLVAGCLICFAHASAQDCEKLKETHAAQLSVMKRAIRNAADIDALDSTLARLQVRAKRRMNALLECRKRADVSEKSAYWDLSYQMRWIHDGIDIYEETGADSYNTSSLDGKKKILVRLVDDSFVKSTPD